LNALRTARAPSVLTDFETAEESGGRRG